MLSFLREQEIENSSMQETSNPAGPSRTTEKQPRGREYLTVSAKSKDVRKSTILLAVLFGIGLLCLLFMIKKSSPQSASAAVVNTEEAQIEMAITRLTGVKSEVFNSMDEIVNKFYEFSNVLQVQVNELVKNPFELELFLASLRGKANSEGKNLSIEAEMILRQQVKNLQLWSIMQSEQGNCCMIDDKILYKGDTIKGFKVIEIGDNFVKLRHNFQDNEEHLANQPEDVEIVLKLSQGY